MMSDMIFEHLGHSRFDKERFNPIVNRDYWVKPGGGLWASPIDSAHGWREWVKVNEFRLDHYNKGSFKFKLKEDAKVFVVENTKQLTDDLLVREENEFSKLLHMKLLDFEQLAKEYDAMLVLISKDGCLYWDLYGWDCDSLLVFNPDVVEEL